MVQGCCRNFILVHYSVSEDCRNVPEGFQRGFKGVPGCFWWFPGVSSGFMGFMELSKHYRYVDIKEGGAMKCFQGSLVVP